MKIDKSEKYTIINAGKKSAQILLTEIVNSYSEFENEHLIIDFSENINIKIKELILFLNISTRHRENGTSFVIISKGIDIDQLPDEINVVPTIIEAFDILEMDAIERDLGF